MYLWRRIGSPPPPRRQLRLNTTANARRSLAALIRELHRAEPDADAIALFRAMVYGLQTLLAFDKAADADELARRLSVIEDRLTAAGK